jgi:glycosyltransferase involved in cell wall biosynthesis
MLTDTMQAPVLTEEGGRNCPVSVTFVSSHAVLGGSERYLETLLGELGPGWARRVISLQEGPANERFREVGHEPVVVHTTGSPLSILLSTWRLRRLLHRQRPDVVHANGIKAALMCVLATRRIPVIWVKVDFSWDGPLARAVARLSTRVIAVSEAVTEALPRRADVSVVRLGVALPPVDREASRRQLRDLLDAPADAPVVTLVGRLHPAKGHHELLAVVPELLRRLPETRIAFIGGDDFSQPECAAGVRQRIEDLGLGHRVKLLGFVADALSLVAGSDVVVVPTVSDDPRVKEGGSLATVEAMALGRVVVAYGHGGLPEVLGDAGCLVPPGDRQALGQAILRVLTDAPLRIRLGEAALARAAERFSLARNTEILEGHYRAVIRRGGQ